MVFRNLKESLIAVVAIHGVVLNGRFFQEEESRSTLSYFKFLYYTVHTLYVQLSIRGRGWAILAGNK